MKVFYSSLEAEYIIVAEDEVQAAFILLCHPKVNQTFSGKTMEEIIKSISEYSSGLYKINT